MTIVLPTLWSLDSSSVPSGFRHPLSVTLYACSQIFLGAFTLCLFFLAGFRYVSFGSAEFAIELFFVGSADFCRVSLPVASIALLCACALCALVLSPVSFVGVDHQDSVVGGRSSLVYLCHIPEFLPSELVGFNFTKPLGELRICVHF